MNFQTRDAARIVGLESWQVQSYAKQGFVDSAHSIKGTGSRRTYDLCGLLKLKVLKRLTEDGFDLRTIRPIFSGLFEIPPFSCEADQQIAETQAWFHDKVLVTCNQFSVRKLVKKERLANTINAILGEHMGLYIIDIGNIVADLIDSIEKDGQNQPN